MLFQTVVIKGIIFNSCLYHFIIKVLVIGSYLVDLLIQYVVVHEYTSFSQNARILKKFVMLCSFSRVWNHLYPRTLQLFPTLQNLIFLHGITKPYDTSQNRLLLFILLNSDLGCILYRFDGLAVKLHNTPGFSQGGIRACILTRDNLIHLSLLLRTDFCSIIL